MKGPNVATSQNLSDMKLPELKELAKQMGLRGTSTMRKLDLVATLEAARSGGEAPAGVTVKQISLPTTSSSQESAAQGSAAHSESRGAGFSAPQEQFDTESDRQARREREDRASRVADIELDLNQRRRNRASRVLDTSEEKGQDNNLGIELPRRRRHNDDAVEGREVHDSRDAESDSRPIRARRSRESSVADLDDILSTLPDRSGKSAKSKRGHDDRDSRIEREDRGGDDRGNSDNRESRSERSERSNRRSDRNNRGDRNSDRSERSERSERSNRRNDRNDRSERGDRNNDRNDRSDNNQNEETPEENLVPVAGIVDILDSYAFVRTSGYLPGASDVYISMGQVKKYGLRKGDAVRGFIRAQREGERRNQRQKFVPLQSIESINGMTLEEAAQRPQFSKLTPVYPQERLRMETTSNKITGRLIDIVAPIGKGQRGLIVSPPKAGKTITLQQIANAISANNPEVHLMVVLVDERPEEVTDMERTVQGEIIASTFDRPATDHTIVAELAIERAKRLVELGQDVVVLLDSMTRLARAYNIAAPTSGRILSGGVDAQALYPPKKFFGAARNIENGGSLTIISSALVETGSKMDEVIFEEFKGTGNMELRLSRELSEKRMFPAIDINASGTRREELITSQQELAIIYRLRRALGGLEPEAAYQQIVTRLKKTSSNAEFLAGMAQSVNN